jgi:hypothetical protein
MRLEYVAGRPCFGGDCPALYVSDRGTLVVVGDLVDPESVSDLRVAAHERAVELPMELIDWIAKVRRTEA